jgi:hypothetical protein
MSPEPALAAAADRLRAILATKDRDATLKEITAARDEVILRYQPVFDAENLPRLSAEEFRQFLVFKNNRHWMSLQRMGPAICADMDRLRKALAILVDETRPLAERLNELLPQRGPAYVPRLHKAVLTPILLICHPEKYGVWNAISEGAMKTFAVWPELEPNAPVGDRYAKVNDILKRLAADIGVDLWTLDALWWRVEVPVDPPPEEVVGVVPGATLAASGGETLHTFGLERHLQEFLRDNWAHTSLGKEWKLYEEDGDPEAGFEYPCNIGRIDLLAKHRTESRWLVIELKRNQTSDQTVGQVLRYIGWVKKHMAQAGEQVEGLVIAHDADEGIGYALTAVSMVRLQFYEVQFRLREAGE